jgi:hypothetical protein
MVTWVPTTLSRFGFERRTRLFSWTSHSSAALGEQPGDRASVPTSGVGLSRIAAKAVRFSSRQLLNMRQLRTFGCCATLRPSDGLSRTWPANHDPDITFFDESPNFIRLCNTHSLQCVARPEPISNVFPSWAIRNLSNSQKELTDAGRALANGGVCGRFF